MSSAIRFTAFGCDDVQAIFNCVAAKIDPKKILGIQNYKSGRFEVLLDDDRDAEMLLTSGLPFKDRILSVYIYKDPRKWLRVFGIPLLEGNLALRSLLCNYGVVHNVIDETYGWNSCIKTGVKKVLITPNKDIPDTVTICDVRCRVAGPGVKKSCFKCSSLDHVKKDCTSQPLIPANSTSVAPILSTVPAEPVPIQLISSNTSAVLPTPSVTSATDTESCEMTISEGSDNEDDEKFEQEVARFASLGVDTSKEDILKAINFKVNENSIPKESFMKDIETVEKFCTRRDKFLKLRAAGDDSPAALASCNELFSELQDFACYLSMNNKIDSILQTFRRNNSIRRLLPVQQGEIFNFPKCFFQVRRSSLDPFLNK